MNVRVKVCGIRTVEDALLAVEEGAWALGFIFHPPSPRYVPPDLASSIIERLPRKTLTVGVFVDRPLEEVNAAVEKTGLGAVQLHGSEEPDYAAAIQAGEVWKAFRVGPEFDLALLRPYAPGCRVLLDSYRPGIPGGTGEPFDWELARRAAEEWPIILAGGLNARNVAAALSSVRPYAVDLSSGLESSPGVKDPEKIRELFKVLRGLNPHGHDQRRRIQ